MTLTLALIVLAGWVRSREIHDRVWLYFPASIQYWSLVIPLALLSAYLLLGKPRIVKPKIAVENRLPE
jgi:hypothetical protein